MGQLAEQVAALEASALDLATEVARLTTENADLRAQLEAHQEPDPRPTRTVFGACVHTTVAAVATKYGPAAALRIFDNKRGTAFIPARPADARLVHVSWKLTAVPTDTQLERMMGPLRAGDMVTCNHEIDVKHKRGTITNLAAELALITAVHRAMKRVRPDLVTCHVLAGWRFSGSGQTPDPYVAEADVLGVDLDGANDRTSARDYLDWSDDVFLVGIRRFADAHYGGRWCAPEFGERLLDRDIDGALRLAAIRAQVPRLVAAGAESVLWFDQDSDPTWAGYPLKFPGEVAYWRELVAG